MDFNLETLATVVVVAFIVFTIIMVVKSNKDYRKQSETQYFDMLKAFITDVNESAENVLSKYPDLELEAEISGTNKRKPFDLGNVYGKTTNLTFPIVTPTKTVRYSNTQDTSELATVSDVVLSGTVGHYTIVLDDAQLGKKLTYDSVAKKLTVVDLPAK